MLKQDPRTYYLIEEIGPGSISLNMLFKNLDEYIAFVELLKFKYSHLLKRYRTGLHYSFDKVNYFPEE